ncbi:MAG: glycosyltransferase family 4 protein [Lachnospiraceae bacterium]|nr:glycosyltransferase family 4 protein [Lachnospiraceae bacterium]MBQ7833506.1 glycosyltransferase family 4 protein [Lachnospiraceae bacterium]
MRVTFVSNYINHHQIPVSEVLYEKWGEGYHFIQTEPMEEERIQLGWDVNSCKLPYVLEYGKEPETCRHLIMDSDIVIFGGTDDESYIQERLKAGKIVIRYSERLYREGQWKAISPRGLRKKYLDHTRYGKAPVYLLCSGGYVADDFNIIKAYKGKRFRWGYFTAFEESSCEERRKWKESDCIRILWAGRFIGLKHPEEALQVAANLKKKGISFKLTMAGGGNMDSTLKEYVLKQGLEDCVEFPGFCKPSEIRMMMKTSHIFLFTSNYREGWGAVLNEAMNSGCAVVASHAIGAVPFLLKHEKNGLIYKSGDVAELTALTEKLCRDEELRYKLGEAAYETIATEWNPVHAAKALIDLCEELLQGTFTFRESGPLSEAKVIKQGKMYRYLRK